MSNLNDYSKQISAAPIRYQEGDELSGDLVYYQCRKRSKFRLQITEEGPTYTGRLNSINAQCLKIEDGKATDGLSAKVIIAECGKEPEKPKVFNMSSADKGQRGLLRSNVSCQIQAMFGSIPRRKG